MPWGYAAVAAATIYSSSKASKASGKASDAQQQAAKDSAAVQREMYLSNKATLDPFIAGGTEAFDVQRALSGAMGPEAQREAYASYEESPGVAWAREQGMKGMEADIASTGRGGGARLKAISKFNQGLALQDFSASFNRLGSVTGVGLSAAGALAGVGMQSAAGQSQALTQGGQALAGGYLGRAAALQQGVSGLSSLAGMYYGNNNGKNR